MSAANAVDIIAQVVARMDAASPSAIAAHVVSVLAASGHTIVKPECDGDFGCPAIIHIHGCYSDVGNCDDPDDHDTLIRAETATVAKEDAVVAERKEAQPVRDQLDLNPNNLALLGSTIPVAALDSIREIAKRWMRKRLEEGIAGSYAMALEHCADELDAAIDMAAAAEEGTNG